MPGTATPETRRKVMATSAGRRLEVHSQSAAQGEGGASQAESECALERAYLSVAQFCKLTGLSSSTVRRRIVDGSIRTFQPGGPRSRVLIPTEQLNFKLVSEPGYVAPSAGSDGVMSKRRSGRRPKWFDELNNALAR